VVPESPSFALTSAIETVGCGSSFWIVPTAWLSVMLALTAAERFTKNVSSGSKVVSPLTDTVTVPLTERAGMVSVPEVAV
jgi:hypothetical protein